jgi:hypothetical protein
MTTWSQYDYQVRKRLAGGGKKELLYLYIYPICNAGIVFEIGGRGVNCEDMPLGSSKTLSETFKLPSQ